MFDSLALLGTDLEALETAMSDADRLRLDGVFQNLRAYAAVAFGSRAAERKGDDLACCLDAVFSLSISLLEGIDSGISGLDDQLAQDFSKLKLKYLGREGTGMGPPPR
jgi:hypothetical protein